MAQAGDAWRGRDRSGEELPTAPARRQTRLARIRQVKEALEAEGSAVAEKDKKEDATAAEARVRRSFTDREVGLWHTANGHVWPTIPNWERTTGSKGSWRRRSGRGEPQCA